MGLGIPEIVIIILAVVVLLFGGKKVVELARGMGRASGEFKKARMEIENEIKQESDKSMSSGSTPEMSNVNSDSTDDSSKKM